MPSVQFTSNLERFYLDLTKCEIEAENIKQLLEFVNKKLPGLTNYILDDQKALRHHVNIFINDALIKDRIELQYKMDQV